VKIKIYKSMEIEKEIAEINGKLDEVMSFLRKTDVKTNEEIRKILGFKSKKTLLNWYSQGCPRESSTHASLSKVMDWRRKTITKSE
jgi:hypothetical protein